MNGSTRHILTFLVILNSAFWVISQDVERDCETIEVELVDASQVFNIQCDTIGTLAIRLWEYNGSAFLLDQSKTYRTIAIEGGSILNEFLKLNGKKMDTLYYHEIHRKKVISLEEVKLDYFNLFVEYKVKLSVNGNVSIQHLVARGFRINAKSAKEMVKIDSLREVECFESNITKSARKVFVKNKIIITMIER